ncbi:hypothetical protein LX32DRAFT_707158 [Colletotrichum zoysiae]|uniref:Uncharacterized protein n=1 Tax=Colletotrichum zoysiae TaxID=1216348 RepID=A0AAD9H8G0_9PEZI|nr:hypothetical protein LX32DRAFT_707158 [Colletotrichum zoysiae]
MVWYLRLLAVSFILSPATGILVTPGQPPGGLEAQGVKDSRFTFSGHPIIPPDPNAIGTFTNGPSGLTSGIIMSTGLVTNAVTGSTPNTNFGYSMGPPIRECAVGTSQENLYYGIFVNVPAQGVTGIRINYLFATQEPTSARPCIFPFDHIISNLNHILFDFDLNHIIYDLYHIIYDLYHIIYDLYHILLDLDHILFDLNHIIYDLSHILFDLNHILFDLNHITLNLKLAVKLQFNVFPELYSKPYPNYYIKFDADHYTKWNLNYVNLELDGNKLNLNLCLCNYVCSLQYIDQSNNTSVDVTHHYISFFTNNNTNNKITF